MTLARKKLVWTFVVAVIAIPIIEAATSPLLAWRDAIYIAAGFSGIIAMSLLVMQPILAAGYLSGLFGRGGKVWHRWIGAGLVAAVVAHVVGLWITSPPDVVDALLFMSPTPFSAWGVIAMWALLATAGVAGFRWKLRMRPVRWRRVHVGFAAMVVVGTVIHVILIEGTMGAMSKLTLCVLLPLATARALWDLKIVVKSSR